MISELRSWVRQQRKDGVERVVLDRDYALSEEELSALKAAAAPAATTEISEGEADMTGAATGKVDDARSEILRLHPDWEGSELVDLAQEIDACRACGLSATRGCSVPGAGNPRAKLVFVGEAPGAEEDRQGVPFVGRAGQLLDKILLAIDLKREDVHILNILKCRPPENRNPAAPEIEACRPFLERQIDIIQPGILVALGLFSSQWLTGKKLSLTKLRAGGPYLYRDIPVYATYHPAALLRNPNWKRPAWDDFKLIREEYLKL